MSIYYIGAYDIHDAAAFAAYPSGVAALLPRYGGQLLAADTRAHVLEGAGRAMHAIIAFPSFDAALGLYDDPSYQALKRLRQAATRNTSMVLVAQASKP